MATVPCGLLSTASIGLLRVFLLPTSWIGHRLPFAENTFDCVLITDVLHHTDNPLEILKEAKRVSRRYVLIKDHYGSNPKDFSRLKFADYIGNKPYGIRLPYGFLTRNEWINLVQNDCGFSIVAYKTFRFNFIDPCKHILLKVKV
jgi:SAM-dependent methyltransferase